MSKKKHLCDWDSKNLDKKWDKYLELVRDPEYICPKCGRMAKDEKSLCKSEKL